MRFQEPTSSPGGAAHPHVLMLDTSSGGSAGPWSLMSLLAEGPMLLVSPTASQGSEQPEDHRQERRGHRPSPELSSVPHCTGS